ncbi:hypothetical protein Sjap_004304 [Stephania japonica]|uniref:dolichol kinase n=1 Tax=Stephania japonica TaxID=461633 RepID=A0AAP0PKT3_9MAGN
MAVMGSSSAVWNGERAVVALFVSRVLFSSPPSLVPESLALAFLALAGFLLEICAERSNALARFKTRPGASSGILLGAVTLPTVMLSRLIQQSRAVLSDDIGHQEVEYLTMQYWYVSVSCFGVLAFLSFISWCQANGGAQIHAQGTSGLKFKLFYVAIYATLCFMSLATKSYSGLHLAMKLIWVFSHGLAAIKLIQDILHVFPSCASIGEALLVTAGFVLYFGDMLVYTLAKINLYLTSSTSMSVLYGIKRTEISTIIQGLLIALIVFPLIYKFILKICSRLTHSINQEARPNGEETSIVFYVTLAVILILLVPLWMEFVQDFQMHPFLWVFNFVFTEPLKRLTLCMYWITVISASVLRFYNISKHSKIERILLRKYYHLVAVLMFSPALIFQPSFLDLAFGAALAVFLMLEVIRVWRIWPFGKQIHQFMNAFADHRDSDLLIVSHFSLLLGCALPKWMCSEFNDRPLAPFAGILSLGIGDTMASMVGHKYGVLRWSKTGKKTVEGTAAGITSVLVACSVLLPLVASTGYILSQHWLSLVFAVTVSGLLEAYTAQLDNAFIPLVFYSLLCL